MSKRPNAFSHVRQDEADEPKTKKVKKTVNDWELINDAKALWCDLLFKAISNVVTLTHVSFEKPGHVTLPTSPTRSTRVSISL